MAQLESATRANRRMLVPADSRRIVEAHAVSKEGGVVRCLHASVRISRKVDNGIQGCGAMNAHLGLPSTVEETSGIVGETLVCIAQLPK